MPNTPTRTPKQVAVSTRQRERPKLRAAAKGLRGVARPARAKALARVLHAARDAEFEDGLDAQLLHRAGYEAHDYCDDLLGARLTASELHEILVGHIIVATAKRPAVGTNRALWLPGISDRLAEDLRRLPFPAKGKVYGKPEPAIGKLASRGYGEHLPQWLLDFARGHHASSADDPAQKDAEAGPPAQPALPTAPGPEAATASGKVAFATLKTALEQHGKATEGVLSKHAEGKFPGLHVPRAMVRDAIDELWGRPGRIGRPPKTPQ
jgi:hypothetical protein